MTNPILSLTTKSENAQNLVLLNKHLDIQTQRINKLRTEIAKLSNEEPVLLRYREVTDLKDAKAQYDNQKQVIRTSLGDLRLKRTGEKKALSFSTDLVRDYEVDESEQDHEIIFDPTSSLDKCLKNGRKFSQEDDYVLAHSYFDCAIKKFPNNFEGYYEKAYLAYRQGDLEVANTYCEKAFRLALNDESVELLRNAIMSKRAASK